MRAVLRHCLPEEMLVPLFHELIERTKIDPAMIEDVCIGTVLQPGGGAISSRIGAFLGGVSERTAVCTVNRQCASGLQACANIAGAIKAGQIDIGVAGGVESMTHFDMLPVLNPAKLTEKTNENDSAQKCLLAMGLTSENVALKYSISRLVQDTFAAASHEKAARAQDGHLFDEEIVPVSVTDESGNTHVCDKDDGIRRGTSVEGLAKLRPVFTADGSTTAGNASQLSDGAAMCILARRSTALAQGLPIVAKFVSFSAVGVPPDVMGVGPAVAIPSALEKARVALDQVDVVELNEAFASQAVYCVQALGIPEEKVNPNGGGIALGHPLGATGCRQLASLLSQLRRTNSRYGLVAMCVGTGMGACGVFENEVFSG
eukprot:Polyplicarium_translucidae@DN2156_c0_g1_i1.p1